MSCELFSSPDLADLCFQNMLDSYIHSAVTHGVIPVLSTDAMKQFLDKILNSEAAQKTYITTHGKMHLVDGKIVHLIAYE